MTVAWQATTLSPDLRVDVVPRARRPDAATLAEVDRIWNEAVLAMPALFNGRIFSADHVSSGCIVGHWTDFKFAYAQIRRPDLFEALGVRSVAVCGVITCPDGIVFGRRSATAIYQAGFWQCPPAGSVERRQGEAERVDLHAQLAAELEEELGLAWHDINSVRPLSAVEHPGSHVVDIGFALETGRRGIDIIGAHAAAEGRREHDDIVVVPSTQLERQLDEWGETLMPTARSFLAVLLKNAG